MNPLQYDSAKQQQRPLVTGLIRISLLAGCLFTGMHNYSLYFRGLNGTVNAGTRTAVAVGIAFILEAAFYFSVEGRGRVFVTEQQRKASAWGAFAIFVVITINTVTDHAMNIGKVGEGGWLSAWATYGAAACVVGIVGYIGYLKAHSPEAMLAAEAAKAEHARVMAIQAAQTEVLAEPEILEHYKAEARKWALASVHSATQGIASLPAPALPAAPAAKPVVKWQGGKQISGNGVDWDNAPKV